MSSMQIDPQVAHKSASPPTNRSGSYFSPPPSDHSAPSVQPTPVEQAHPIVPRPTKSLSPPQTSRHTPPTTPPRHHSLGFAVDQDESGRAGTDLLVAVDPEMMVEDPLETAKPPQGKQADPQVLAQEKADWTSSFVIDPSLTLQEEQVEQVQPQAQDIGRPAIPPWNLTTEGLSSGTDSQPQTSTSNSPATPVGLGAEGLYHGQAYEELSRQNSMTDLNSYIGSDLTSESRFEMMGHLVDPDAEGSEVGQPEGVDKDGGVPAPKPKKSHARKQPPGHIKRARNAFILFRKHITDSNLIPTSVEVKHQNISVVAAKMWREAPQDVRQKFQEQARIEKEEHQRLYPGYRYQPVFRRADIIRRRVRKDPAEDDKVEAVAEALIKGKAGDDLEKEIKEQLTTRSEMSESDAEGSARPSGSRRRRRDVGQLSKGAIRAQRAQARAKQMRQNLLGPNLLNISMYNAAAQAAAAAQRAGLQPPPGGMVSMANHPGAAHHHHLQYAMAESYLPMGYDGDGRPISYEHPMYQQGMALGGVDDSGEMYRLPPIDQHGLPGNGGVYDHPHGPHGGHAPHGWTDGQGVMAGEYWDENAVGGEGMMYDQSQMMGEGYYPPILPGDEYANHDYANNLPLESMAEYHLPPLLDHHQDPPGSSAQQGHGSLDHLRFDDQSKDLPDPRMREWARDGQQTPSGHVMFNERLFDGALGSATLPALEGRRDEGLSGFDEAIAQVNDIAQW